MPEDNKPSTAAVWVTDPTDHTTLAHVQVDSANKTYRATLADGTEAVIGSPEIASALARCLLLAVADEKVPVLSMRTST